MKDKNELPKFESVFNIFISSPHESKTPVFETAHSSHFYTDYLYHFITREKIPTIPLAELECLGEAIIFYRDDGMMLVSYSSLIDKLAYLIFAHQTYGPDETEAYAIFSKATQCDKDYPFYLGLSETKREWLFYFLIGLSHAKQASIKRINFIADQLFLLSHDIRSFKLLIAACSKLSIYQTKREIIAKLLLKPDILNELYGIDLIQISEILLQEKDYPLFIELLNNIPKENLEITRNTNESFVQWCQLILNKNHNSNSDEALKELRSLMKYPEAKESLVISNLEVHLEEVQRQSAFIIGRQAGLDSPPLKEAKETLYKEHINMPLGLYIAIMNSKNREKTLEAFHSFVLRFNKANQFQEAQEGEHQLIDLKKFMMGYVMKLINLYDCFGSDVFPFMQKMIATSPQKLNRYLNNLQFIQPKYYPALQTLQLRFPTELIKKEPSSLDTILIQLGQLEEIISESSTDSLSHHFSETEFLEIFQIKSLKEIEEHISQLILKLYKNLLNIDATSQLDLSKLNSQTFQRLLIGRKSMKDHQLVSVYDKLIEYDLTKGLKFTDLSENPAQENPLGKQLSKHNEKITEELSEKKIDTERAFQYSKTHQFSTESDTTVDLPKLAAALYDDLINLKIALLALKQSNCTFFQSDTDHAQIILRYIEQIKNQLTQGKHLQTIQIENGILDKKLNNIASNLTELLKKPNLPSSLQEHARHFLDRKTLVMTSRVQTKLPKTQSPHKQKKDFIVQQWDKSQLETFLLGDYLGCCLAPDGGRFPAIVQRRMDRAMMMHVVYDKASNEPVCGNWLFFARDKNKPNDVYVVANYIEIRAGYGLNKALRDKLVEELLAFTGQYATDIHAKGFIIRPLTYGLIPDFTSFQKIPMNIEKIGGFFSPTQSEDTDETRERYYLDALVKESFYVYENALLLHLQDEAAPRHF